MSPSEQLLCLRVLCAPGGRSPQDSAAFATTQDLKDFSSGNYFYANAVAFGSSTAETE